MHRRPRPSCCTNSTGLWVGRSRRSVSTSGGRCPPLDVDTEDHLDLARLQPSHTASRWAGRGHPSSSRSLKPRRVNSGAMNCACATDTQNPSPRIAAQESTHRLEAWTMSPPARGRRCRAPRARRRRSPPGAREPPEIRCRRLRRRTRTARAAGRRRLPTGAARWCTSPPNRSAMPTPSVRSGVAVRPTISRGLKCS